MEAGGPSECWECFALHDSDNNLKIAKASIILKLADRCNAMSKATDRTYPVLLFHCITYVFFSVFISVWGHMPRQHDECVKRQSGWCAGKLIWLITGIIPFRRDVTLQRRVVQFSLYIYCMSHLLVKQMSRLCRQTSWAAHVDAVTQIKHLGPEGKRLHKKNTSFIKSDMCRDIFIHILAILHFYCCCFKIKLIINYDSNCPFGDK